ncbi:hypothetical protein PV04_02493 [Phialophora macrospora]|uniref:Uncharacterized protein n=1 Tax=Phialophora macrospora TaxID=1851006 RepID=A0A0D2CYA9_9EURO|nr:hypothetical protein PV04_02493 [Phialophora macrospora]
MPNALSCPGRSSALMSVEAAGLVVQIQGDPHSLFRVCHEPSSRSCTEHAQSIRDEPSTLILFRRPSIAWVLDPISSRLTWRILIVRRLGAHCTHMGPAMRRSRCRL